MATTDKDFETFLEVCRKAVADQVSGRTEAFQSLWSRNDDVVLIGAAGSHQRGGTMSRSCVKVVNPRHQRSRTSLPRAISREIRARSSDQQFADRTVAFKGWPPPPKV